MQAIHICWNCDGVIENNIVHNCIRGITENINRLSTQIKELKQKKTDPHDGLKYALKIIDETESKFKAVGIIYTDEEYDPFHQLRNNIRMLLGLPLIAR